MTYLKAFVVLDTYENMGGIVFAKTNAQARRMGAETFADGDFHNVTCRRAPYADHCAEDGHVSNTLLIDNGWHFECAWSGERIDQYTLQEKGLVSEDVIGHQHGLAFTTAVHEAEYRLDKARKDRFGLRWRRRFAKIVQRRFPDAKIIPGGHSSVSRIQGVYRLTQCRVEFDWSDKQISAAAFEFTAFGYLPGEQLQRRPNLLCAMGDKAMFEAWCARQRELRGRT